MTIRSGWAAAQARNTVYLALWTGAWLVTLAVASLGPALLWDGHGAITLVALGVNLAVGAGMVLANKRHLLGLDELHRAVQLEAMAWTLGIGLVGGPAWQALETAKLLPFDAEIGHLMMGMALTYLVALAVGLRRFA